MNGTGLKTPIVVVLAAFALVLAACAGDDEPQTTGSPSPSATGPVSPSPAAELPLHIDESDFWIVPATGGEALRIAGSPYGFTAEWSADGGRLAYVRKPISEESELRVISPSGEGLAGPVMLKGDVSDLGWSPEGGLMAVVLGYFPQVLSLVDPATGQVTELARGTPPQEELWIVGWRDEARLVAVKSGVLLEFDTGAGTQRQVSEVALRRPWPGGPVLSGDGSRLAAATPQSACGADAGRLMLIDLDTGAVEDIASAACSINDIQWSPDGGRIAFAVLDVAPPGSPAANAIGISVVDLQTRSVVRVTRGLDGFIRWLPDGQRLAFTRFPCWGCDAGGGKFMIADANGGGERLLVENRETALSPDGLSFASAGDGVILMDVDGGVPRTLVPGEAGWSYFVQEYSADGAHISYVRLPAQGTRRYEMNADGTDLVRHAPSPQGGTLSPDGSRMATLESLGRPEKQNVLILSDADGANRVVTEIVNGVWVDWAPDGSRLLVEAGSSLYVVNADGTGLRKLDYNASAAYTGAWSPDGTMFAVGSGGLNVLDIESGHWRSIYSGAEGRPSWTADSELIAFIGLLGNGRRDVYIIGADGRNLRQLTDDTALESELAIAPDAHAVAFMRPGRDKDSIAMIVDVEDLELRTIYEQASPSGQGGKAMAWSPDSRRLAFFGFGEGRGVFVVSDDGTGRYQLLAADAEPQSVIWISRDRLRITTFLGGL